MSTPIFTVPPPMFGSELERPDSLAVFEITLLQGELRTTSGPNGQPFSPSDYSRFKYGFYPQAEAYGSLLADAIQVRFHELGVKPQDEIVVIGTPYKSVPNADKLLAGVAERKLRNRGYKSSISRIYQHQLAQGDYGTLPAALRDKRNQQKKRFLSEEDFHFKHVVFIDDIRITGSIERSVLALLEYTHPLSMTIINLARLDPEVALTNPRIEDALNHAAVQTLGDLLPLMTRRDEFVLITRAVKHILEAEQSELEMFLQQLDKARLIELHHAVVDEGYDQMDRYERSFRILSRFYPY
ncbi:MAG: phosphoribosyltransferase family protein [Candidatus Microsaccharimonas sp.]